MDAVYERGDVKGLILDVRPNGGDELMARELAGCFIDSPRAQKNTIRRDGKFMGPYEAGEAQQQPGL